MIFFSRLIKKTNTLLWRRVANTQGDDTISAMHFDFWILRVLPCIKIEIDTPLMVRQALGETHIEENGVIGVNGDLADELQSQRAVTSAVYMTQSSFAYIYGQRH